LFATQYENDNTAFHRSSAVSGCLALLRTFCQWKIEHQVRKYCVKGLILRNMVRREADACRVNESGYNLQAVGSITSQCKKFWGNQILWLQASNSILFETLPVKAQNDKIC